VRKPAVLVTGAGGGIGRALIAAFGAAGYQPVATDRGEDPGLGCPFISADLQTLATDEKALAAFSDDVRKVAGGPLRALVNNAAYQHLGSTEEIGLSDFAISLQVNVAAPFALVRSFLSDLSETRGTVLNIGSVHTRATKPGFVAYATSKAAIDGLTRALAVDLGGKVRVLALAPAAVGTDMLRAGFDGNPEGLEALAGVHPAGRIASPEEIAEIAVFLCSDKAGFLTGTTLYADGGVLSRLHDPA
jgi:NAD(P)-dependent dehydrogenase (short-subunit alcohol dehydrogenase family)